MNPWLRSWCRSTLFSVLAVGTVYGTAALASEAEQGATQLASGYSASQAYQLRAQWDVPSFIHAKAPGVYSYQNLSEFLPQATVARMGQVSELPSRNDPGVGQMGITSSLDAKTLDQFLAPGASPLQGIGASYRTSRSMNHSATTPHFECGSDASPLYFLQTTGRRIRQRSE